MQQLVWAIIGALCVAVALLPGLLIWQGLETVMSANISAVSSGSMALALLGLWPLVVVAAVPLALIAAVLYWRRRLYSYGY